MLHTIFVEWRRLGGGKGLPAPYRALPSVYCSCALELNYVVWAGRRLGEGLPLGSSDPGATRAAARAFELAGSHFDGPVSAKTSGLMRGRLLVGGCLLRGDLWDFALRALWG